MLGLRPRSRWLFFSELKPGKRGFALASIYLKESKKLALQAALSGVLTEEDTVSEKWFQATRSWLRRSTRNRLASAAQVRVLSVSNFFWPSRA